MITKLIIMFIIGAVFGVCSAGISYLTWTDYKMYKEDEQMDLELRDMEQYYLAEYYQDGKENK